MNENPQIAEIECELRLMRNKLANCESQNRILVAYVCEMQHRRHRREKRLDAARQRKRYACDNGAAKKRAQRQRGPQQTQYIKLMAPAVRQRLWDQLQQTL
jgi:hypothetical protein